MAAWSDETRQTAIPLRPERVSIYFAADTMPQPEPWERLEGLFVGIDTLPNVLATLVRDEQRASYVFGSLPRGSGTNQAVPLECQMDLLTDRVRQLENEHCAIVEQFRALAIALESRSASSVCTCSSDPAALMDVPSSPSLALSRPTSPSTTSLSSTTPCCSGVAEEGGHMWTDDTADGRPPSP